MHIVKIEKLVFGGQGMGRLDDGTIVFVWNALPHETVHIQILKKKKGYAEAVATKIIEPSPFRITPKDPHYLSTGPWQIMEFEKENEWKVDIATETYGKIGGLILHGDKPIIVHDEHEYEYRNKMEFSFAEDENQHMSLAFFERGAKQRIPVAGSSLCRPEITQTADHVLAWVRKNNIPIRSLKSLIVRSAGGKAIAGLFIKDKLSFHALPELTDTCIGFVLYYSTHKSPASVPSELLYSVGTPTLTETILGTKLSFGLFSFFQINPPIFEMAIKDIAAFLDPKEPLVDFYSGVGAIGLPLSGVRTETILVESNEEAAQFAKQNITQNNLLRCTVHAMPSEKLTDEITSDRQIIVDPPRAGLHPHVVRQILTKRPPRVIYLSCDIATQARDMRLLSEGYKPVFIRLYNFFPRTAHIEGLVVLERVSLARHDTDGYNTV